MKEIKINKITLSNFKGIKSREVEFGGSNVKVCGANATGKTTIFDAFTWCLFGKDSTGKQDFELKTKKNGEVVPKIEHSVTVELAIDGTVKTFGRRLVEEWTTTRGTGEVRLKGNTTHYIVDGVEVKAGDYAKYINATCDEQLFKLITNPTYFGSLDWQTKRQILIQIAGDVSVSEVADMSDERQANVVEMISSKGADLLAAEIASKKKKIKDELSDIPVQISAIESVCPDEPDYATLDARKAALESKLDNIKRSKEDAVTANRSVYEKIRDIEAEIQATEANIQKALYDAQQGKRDKEMAVNKARAEVDMADGAKQMAEQILASKQVVVKRLEDELASKQAEWKSENAVQYVDNSSALVCPIFGHVCTDASAIEGNSLKRDKAREAFVANHKAKMDKIVSEGKEAGVKLAEAKANALKSGEDLQEKVVALDDARKAYEAALDDLKSTKDVVEGNVPECMVGRVKIQELKAKQNDIRTSGQDNAMRELNDIEDAATKELDDIKAKLAVRSVIANHKANVSKLEAREMELAQQMADVESLECTLGDIVHKQMDALEAKVNGLFKLCSFSMFEPQINGGEKATCVMLINGVKYGYGANRAAEINAGLDVISTLCSYHGIHAPIFVDNAEAVNTLVTTESQTIQLVVTDDKDMQIIKY